MRRRNPRFTDAAARANQPIVAAVRAIAQIHRATPAQVAIAWTMAQSARLGIAVVPIPGTKRAVRLEENAAATAVDLTAADLAKLDGLAAGVVGARY
jgi:aryl-alcohol dehydrogenase-like predicted oxidoreductase